MPTFAIETNKPIDKYIKQIKENLKINVFMTGKIIKLDNFYLFYIKPLVPPIHLLGFAFLAGALLLNGFRLSPWLIPGFAFMIPGVFHTKYFFYIILLLGFKRKKIDVKAKLVRNSKTLEYIILRVV